MMYPENNPRIQTPFPAMGASSHFYHGQSSSIRILPVKKLSLLLGRECSGRGMSTSEARTSCTYGPLQGFHCISNVCPGSVPRLSEMKYQSDTIRYRTEMVYDQTVTAIAGSSGWKWSRRYIINHASSG